MKRVMLCVAAGFLMVACGGKGDDTARSGNQTPNDGTASVEKSIDGCPSGTTKSERDGGEGWKEEFCLDSNGKKQGMEIGYQNGSKRGETPYRDGKIHGTQTKWDREGKKNKEQEWRQGEKHGTATYWYGSGQKAEVVEYQNGKKHGKIKRWYRSGKVERIRECKMGECTEVCGKRKGVPCE